MFGNLKQKKSIKIAIYQNIFSPTQLNLIPLFHITYQGCRREFLAACHTSKSTRHDSINDYRIDLLPREKKKTEENKKYKID